MARRVSFKQMRRDAPEWIFPWKGRGEPWLPKLIAIGFAVALFGGILGFVRIRTSSPNPWGLEKAHVIRVLQDTPEGRVLAQKARENGPSPVRFQTADWPQLARMEAELLAIPPQSTTPYQPHLRPWPESPPEVPRLTRPGLGVLPPLPAAPPMPSPQDAGAPQPVIMPMSGLSEQEIPTTLPTYDGVVDAAMLAETVRYLLRLEADGRVSECLALSGGSTLEGTAQLSAWLQGIRFSRQNAAGPVWAAVRIRFLNKTP